jgi:hypothetical protein
MNLLFAYIDPFTASLALQFLAMGFLSVAVFFQQVKAFVFGLFTSKKTTNTDSSDAETVIAKFPQQEERNEDVRDAA